MKQIYSKIECFTGDSSANDGLFKRDSISVIFTPIFHLAGFVAVLMLLFMGNTAVTMERFDIEEYLMRIDQYKVIMCLNCQRLICLRSHLAYSAHMTLKQRRN